MQVLETKCRSLGLVAITFTHWAVSPAQHWKLNFFLFQIFIFFLSFFPPLQLKGLGLVTGQAAGELGQSFVNADRRYPPSTNHLGKCPISDTSSILEASFELIPLPITGFSVGQPEMAPQSEPRDGFNNAQGKMSSREESTLHSCSGKWGQRRSRERIFLLPQVIHYAPTLPNAILDIWNTLGTNRPGPSLRGA